MRRRLLLRREALTELTVAELTAVNAAAVATMPVEACVKEIRDDLTWQVSCYQSCFNTCWACTS